MAVKITTDNKWRYLQSGSELPKSQRKEFDYLTDTQYEDYRFAKYGKNYYDIQEFMRLERAESGFKGWHGYHADSYFSGIVVKVNEKDAEKYKIGHYTVSGDV